jgi:hypothetical protein
MVFGKSRGFANMASYLKIKFLKVRQYKSKALGMGRMTVTRSPSLQGSGLLGETRQLAFINIWVKPIVGAGSTLAV